jgi:hypothetical protein
MGIHSTLVRARIEEKILVKEDMSTPNQESTKKWLCWILLRCILHLLRS